MPHFGQILAALYQDDIVEEDDIRTWHKKPSAQGVGVKPPASQENFKKCWTVGAHMIKQFDEQESEDESEEEKSVKPTASGPQQPGTVPLANSEGDESEEDDDESEEEDDESE